MENGFSMKRRWMAETEEAEDGRKGIYESTVLIETPTRVPCWQVFEPVWIRGPLMASLGFSVRAEIAHRSQRRFPSLGVGSKNIFQSRTRQGSHKPVHFDSVNPKNRRPLERQYRKKRE